MRPYVLATLILLAVAGPLFLLARPDQPAALKTASATLSNPEEVEVAPASDRYGRTANVETKPEQQATKPDPSEDQKAPYEQLFHLLSQQVSAGGFCDAVTECLETRVKGNLKLESPLSIQDMASACADDMSLPPQDRKRLVGLFEKAIAESQGSIDLRDWKECASKRVLKGDSQCVKDINKSLVESFFSSMAQDREIFSKPEFQRKWEEATKEAMNQIVTECPGDLDKISEVMGYECI